MRRQVTAYVLKQYGVRPDCPWASDPDSQVLRHRDNRKWFGLLMRLPKSRLGLAGAGAVDVLNVKCDPALGGSMRLQPGIFPAYHMNHDNWLTRDKDNTPDKR